MYFSGLTQMAASVVGERVPVGQTTAYFLAGRVDEARSLYESGRPELFATPLMEITPKDLSDVLVVSGILFEGGEIERAREITAALEAMLAESPGPASFLAFTPSVLALERGDYAAAAQALRAATETGAMQSWWVFLAPSFDADLENPQFAAAIDTLQKEIDRQRESYLANSSLPPI